MESGNGAASSKGVLKPVSDSSDVFQSCILAPLQSAYLYEESKQSFRYKSAVLVKNPVLEEKYEAFRQKLREAGYSDEDLQESYGFLLFDDINKAKTLGESGVLTGNSTCTTLGDPSKGVYISMYADCLDLNRWYHGKSGYIAIIRLTKGKVKKVLENYTQNFLEPSVGFDCHVSEQLPSVSDKTSSFLAFERTQYYVYELLDDGSNRTAQSPSAACPYAIVSFSYTDTKSTLVVPQEKSDVKALVCHYLPWRGQLQIGTQFYSVGLRSTSGALIPIKLPPVVNVNQAISMSDLQQLLPKAVFETRFSGEAFLDGFYCSLCELVPSEADDTSSLALLLQEIKEKDLVLITPLNDGGFLILLHSSHFLTYDDTGSSATEVLQGLFVFPDSRVVVKDIKFGHRHAALSSEVLRLLPVITYAEGEVEKAPIDPSEDLCEALMQHMQSYAALINPGLAVSPSREVNSFPYQYDVPDAYKDLYSSPEWTNRAWQNIKTYLSKPASFQVPISKVSEILAAGQEEQREDFDDCVYICLSSPETPINPASMGIEDRVSDQKSPETVETSVDSGISIAEAQVDLTAMSQNVVPDDLQAAHAAKDNERDSELSELNKSDDMGLGNLLTPPTSEDLPTELIVSITSAEQSTTDETLSVESSMSATKHDDFQLSGFSTIAKLQTAELTSLGTETDKTKRAADCPEVTNLTQTKEKKLQRGITKGQKKVSKVCVDAPTSQTVKVEVDNLNSQKDAQTKESSDNQQLSKPSKVYWRKIKRRKRIFGKLSSKNKKVRSPAAVDTPVAVAEGNKSNPGKQNLKTTILMELEACPLRKKTERWDLKPVVSECGRVLVPHGSVDFRDQIKTLTEKFQSTKDEKCPESMLLDAHSNTLDTVEMEQESSSTPDTTVDETVAKSIDDGTHPQNVVASHVNPEQTNFEQSGCNSSLPDPLLSSKAVEGVPQSNGPSNDLDSVPSQSVQEKLTDTHSRGKGAANCEVMLTKLKSILSRKRKKPDILGQEETTDDTVKETEPCLKMGKMDDSEAFKNAAVESTNAGVKEASEMLSVDPLFAYALGLTPKVSPVNAQETEDQNSQQKEVSTVEEQQISSDEQHQILQRPLSIFPRRGRIKTLKRHQGISADNVKKKCTPFQVSPLSGSTRLLHHHQTMYGDGIKTLHTSVSQGDRSEINDRTPEYPKKHKVRRRKFRYSRTFVNTETSVQVTRQWQGNYDFNFDSKFTSDAKEKTINRALHGPWDFSIQDTNEEVRLIIHMWIGLFYSRSTARFIHVDSNFTFTCSEENGSLEITREMGSGQAKSELMTSYIASLPSVTETSDPFFPKALDLSKKDHTELDQESEILDFSRKFNVKTATSNPEVNRQETHVSSEQKKTCVSSKQKEPSERLNGLMSPPELQEASTLQCYRVMVHSAGISQMPDVSGIPKNEKPGTCQKAVTLEHTDAPSSKGDGLSILSQGVQAESESVCTEPGSVCTVQKSIPADVESVCTERKNVCAEQESICTDQDGVHKVHESSSAKLEGLCSELENIHAEVDSVGAKQESSSAEPESVRAVPERVNAELENIRTDLQSVHVVQESFSAKVEGVCAESESVGAELDRVCTMPKSVPDLDSVCIKPENASTKLEDFSIEKESAEPESATVEPEGVCAMQESTCTITETVLTERASVGDESETNCSHLEGACVGQESICAEEEGILPEPEGVHPEPDAACTLAETVSKVTETVNTERDGVGAEPESVCSLLESVCVGQESVCAEEEGVNPEPEGVHPEPEGVHPEPEGVHREPEGVHPEPEGVHPEPEGVHPEPEGVHPEPEGAHREPEGVCTSAETISNECDSVGAETKSVCSPLESVCVGPESRCAEEKGVPSEPDDVHPEPEGVGTLMEIVSTGCDSVGDESSHLKSVCIGLESVKPETVQTALESGQVLHECNKESRNKKDGTENSETTEMSLVQKDGMDLSKSVADKVDFKDIHTSPFKNKVEFGFEIQPKKAQPTTPQHNFETTDKQETSAGQDCHLYKCFSLIECMQAFKPKTDQDGHKTTSQSMNNNSNLYCQTQRPVMAVKPSKSEEIQADFIYNDLLTENSVEMKPTKTPVVTNTTPASMCMEKPKEISKGNFEGLSDNMQKANDFSSKRTWLPNVAYSKSNTDGAKVPLLDPSCQYQGRDISKFNIIPSSALSMLPFEATSCPKVADKNQGFWADNFVEKTEQTSNSEQPTIEMDEENWPHATTSIIGPKDNGIVDGRHILEPQTSLVCTIFNTGQKRSYPFLEQLSRRCLQDDVTQASLEQECLIFSEQMKQILKKSKGGVSHLQDTKSNKRLSCASPLTIHFSDLEEQEDSLDHWDMSLFGQKIKVDMSDRKDLSEEKTLLPQGPSQRTCNPLEHAGVSGVTTECARLYEAKMHDVCSFKKVSSRSKGGRRDRSHPKMKTSNQFDLCDQMNREMGAAFRNNLNTVVKKSCKTKYRFYMLVTSDDRFFDDTKAQLEAEGHTAVQPPEFFLCENSSSSLLIILRNEDIAEHICEIPHLLELKKSPGVKFIGIDEPDDVMNLTYQELFTRGGFIMFDRTVLESLSLRNMKKMYETMQDLSRMRKWKWMLHYKDSRRLKENARLSAEEKEKKRFLYLGQDAGILDVLPYHECDTISRDEPDYLSCLVRLQVQHISSRYAVFITDRTTDGTFERNGILTLTLNSFLTTPLNTQFIV
ncbi:uncharacterized protein tasor2 isoform X2 [Mugil cephalus]|uniref:uncharacterized protein tasor2 isoform X2 n=1 Tax=Mugil cephalus TaxID=48193 RepID=UPI001FB69FC4|nr:uncharacterized protein tasor2 isoform X2 [Mugil cephalus]